MGLQQFAEKLATRKQGEQYAPRARTSRPKDTGWVSTGDLIIDQVSGGGVPKGCITEIVGEFGAGKTSCCLQTVANVQKDGKAAVYIDDENALNDDYAESLGVQVDNPDLWAVYPYRHSKKIRDLCTNVFDNIESNNVGALVIDSVAGVHPEEWDKGDEKIAERAVFWSKFAPYLAEQAAKHNIVVILVNQLRKKLDFGSFSLGGGPKDDPMGGNAVKYFKSISICLTATSKRTENVKDHLTGKELKQPIGNDVLVKTLKNKCAKPFQKGFTHLTFGKGFDNFVVAKDIFLNKNLITKEKRTYFAIDPKSGEKVKLASGEPELVEYLRSNPAICYNLL